MDSSKNEMEQIQRGLEAFLEKEMDSTRDAGNRKKSVQSAQFREEPEEIQIIGESRDRGPLSGQRQYGDEELWTEEPEDQTYEDEEAYPEEWEDWEDWEDEEAGPVRRGAWDDQAYETAPRRRGRPGYEAYEDAEPNGRRRRNIDDESPRKRSRDYEEEEMPQKRTRYPKKGNSRETDQRKEESRMSKKADKAWKKRRKRKSRLKKFLIIVAFIIVLLGAGLYQLVGAVYSKMNYREIEALAAEPMKEDGVVNILLIGNDSRENGEDGRSDAMILLSISSRTKTIYMTSLLRDIYVDIPGHDGNRLNAAYAFGGAELLMKTIEHNFDIPVNRYMLVNFEAFANLVDAVDGIELELTSEEIEYVNGYLVEYNMLTGREQGTDNMDTSASGLVHLNGPQALAYSRNRYLGTDFGRTERQRKVLTAVIGKLPGAVLTNAGGLVDGLMPNLTTNLTRNECFSLSLMAGKLLTYEILSDNIPQQGTYRDVTIREMQVLEVDFETNIRYLKEKIYGE